MLDELGLLASAIAGRSLTVVPADPAEASWTDGTTVFVETSLADPVEVVVVQASLLAAGSLRPELVSQLARRPALARRYLAFEGHRALMANDFVPPRYRALANRTVADDLADARASLARARTKQPVVGAPASFGTIHAQAVLTAAERIEPAPATTVASRPLPALAEPGDETGDLGDLLSSPVGGGGAVGRLFRKLLSPTRGRAGGGPPGADAPTHFSTGRPGTSHPVASSGPARALDDTAGAAHTGRAYPEWDVHRARYRPDWCTVSEVDAPARDTPPRPPPDAIAFRRPLARLGLGLTNCRRRRQGDDVDLDAAVEAHVDARAGALHDEVYIESLRRRRDLSVLVLLDVSGSAAEPGTARTTVHEHQVRAATALTAALESLGDRVALYGFNSRGRHHVQLLRVKAFDDHLDGRVGTRLASLTPGAYTRLGAAIRHATTLVEQRAGTPRRLLVVLSDGFAYDHGYEGRYGEADARRALVEAGRRGVGCLCISVGGSTDPAALRRVFGAAAYAAVPEIAQLAPVIGPLFRAALQSADVQRRTFRRDERTRERLHPERSMG
ncbi:MAG TPA: VWA domain-containing protein [Acidimicrobiia bacterium]|nr:VWA domain-containing protein [Acidimicrobiia bacterium]